MAQGKQALKARIKSVSATKKIISAMELISNSKLPFVQKPAFVQGVTFWKSMFIPAVIAMTATQDVIHMLSSSIVAIVAGVSAVSVSYLVLYGLHRLDEKKVGDEK